MTIRFLPATIACLVASAATAAQEAISFSWQVVDAPGLGPANGNGIVEPGEDAVIFLHLSFSPGVGGSAIWNTNGGTGQNGVVAGLAGVSFDVFGTQNLQTGTWINTTFATGFNIGGFPGVAANNDLLAGIFGQFILPGETPNPRNHDWFFRARWRPANHLPRDVNFRLGVHQSQGVPGIFLDVGLRDPENNILYKLDTWSFNEPGGSFMVVPSPATMLVAISLFAGRRRRK